MTGWELLSAESLGQALVPAALGVAAIRLCPWRSEPRPPTIRDTAPGRSVLALAGIALAVPAVMLAAVLAGLPYYPGAHLVKLLGFVVLPWILLSRWNRGFRFGREVLAVPRSPRTYLWAAVPVAVFAAAWLFGPFRPNQLDDTEVSAAFLVTAAALTFATANVFEEWFYRVMLQTRLEALLGTWRGIAAGAVLFALLHVPGYAEASMSASETAGVLAAALVLHLPFGVYTGYLWARHRNMPMLVLAHAVVNTLPLFL